MGKALESRQRDFKDEDLRLRGRWGLQGTGNGDSHVPGGRDRKREHSLGALRVKGTRRGEA